MAAAAPLVPPSSIPALPPAVRLLQTGAAGGSGMGSSLPWVRHIGAKRPLGGKKQLKLEKYEANLSLQLAKRRVWGCFVAFWGNALKGASGQTW